MMIWLGIILLCVGAYMHTQNRTYILNKSGIFR